MCFRNIISRAYGNSILLFLRRTLVRLGRDAAFIEANLFANKTNNCEG